MRRRWRTILGNVALVAGTLVAIEVACRAVLWTPSDIPRPPDGLGGQRYSFYPAGAGDLTPGQDGHWLIWNHRPYHVVTNSLGMRNVEEPIDGARRIVVTGDSQTFGPYVANEDAWPGWLEAELRRRAGKAATPQVFNAGVSGYTITDQLAWLRDKGVGFKPDLLLLAVFENDVTDLRKVLAGEPTRPPSESDQDLRLLKFWMKNLRKRLNTNLAAYDAAKRFKTWLEFRGAGVDTARGEGDATWRRAERGAAATSDLLQLEELYAARFREFVATARAAGIPLAVFAIPDPGSVQQRKSGAVAALVGRLARELDLPFLDLLDDLARQEDPLSTLYLLQWNQARGDYLGNGHLSRYGHRVIGRRIAAWITAEVGLLRE